MGHILFGGLKWNLKNVHSMLFYGGFDQLRPTSSGKTICRVHRPPRTLQISRFFKRKFEQVKQRNRDSKKSQTGGRKRKKQMGEKMGRLLVWDTAMSFMWVWSSVLIKIFVFDVLGLGYGTAPGELVKCCVSIVNMFLFAFLSKVSKGGAYNPLAVLSSGLSGDFSKFLLHCWC